MRGGGVEDRTIGEDGRRDVVPNPYVRLGTDGSPLTPERDLGLDSYGLSRSTRGPT